MDNIAEIEQQHRYHLSPEWAMQSGTMLTWPHQETIWAEMQDEIDQVFIAVAKEIAQRQKLIITCFDERHLMHIKKHLISHHVNMQNVMQFCVPSNDIWVRDHGPIAAYHENGSVLMDFSFNGWGEKYPFHLDNNITRALHDQGVFGDTALLSVNMVLEGGSIEVDGAGTLLTTTSCLLSTSRNPQLTQSDIEKQMNKLFGIERILWLNHGYLAGDDTDGHIDTLARFVDSKTICYVRCADENDDHFSELNKMEKQLQTFTNYLNEPYRLIPLPWPKPQYAKFDGRRLPATYANFLVINHAVLVPTYDDPSDDEAMTIIASCFPDRKIIGINCLPVIQWYGSLHCMTMQLPQGVLS